ncbi:DUF411 domain-containing protein [Geminicoccus roseus]|uniref:DUF411 domain-containing protein n=1 Tax=Geminicoccus roseus TaxID=404900 RepID=UPI000408DC0D|nr:DUF411 domain-containing protein [Geminicoccus roseus]
MTSNRLSRRHLMLGTCALSVTAALPAAAQSLPPIHVVKDPGCACCTAWIGYLRAQGFEATVEEVDAEPLARRKRESGIPHEMTSCHTGYADGYVLEGHVPAADIRRLLGERPDAIGLAVPGMPYGSPGMGPEDQREAYEVRLIRRDGSTELFSTYPAA